MLELILRIREHTEAGSILEHMYLFDELQSIKFVGMYCGVNAWALDVDDDILVDEIEPKTCENCKHSVKKEFARWCEKGVSSLPMGVMEDFGCNKWERK